MLRIEKQSQHSENEIFMTERIFTVCPETQTHNVKVYKLLNMCIS